ncbi:DNAJ heat shock N-terminal domain-containing protein [Phycomyces nitens]|nr:DNAJ heat shock N-terminal domain-containing protein [Phycomyces nitens]
MSTHYDILRISKDATTEQIKLRYKELILKHHPDKHTANALGDGDYAHQILKAWEVLRDTKKRQHYDAELNANQLQQPVINAEVDLDDMEYDEESCTFSMECRCSGIYAIKEDEMELGIDVVGCDLCSLRIRVLYDAVEED